jgi:hypothetical protein
MSILNAILAGTGTFLVLFAITVTILDYTNKGKHINRKDW